MAAATYARREAGGGRRKEEPSLPPSALRLPPFDSLAELE